MLFPQGTLESPCPVGTGVLQGVCQGVAWFPPLGLGAIHRVSGGTCHGAASLQGGWSAGSRAQRTSVAASIGPCRIRGGTTGSPGRACSLLLTRSRT